MNHIVKRIETRVLAPPGGFSSISFGSEPPSRDLYRDHDFNPKNKTSKQQQSIFPREPKRSNGSSGNKMTTLAADNGNGKSNGRSNNGYSQYDKPPQDKSKLRSTVHQSERNHSEKENNTRGDVHANTNRKDRRDSLDELVDNGPKPIPGLENYYRSNQGGQSRNVSPVDNTSSVSQSNQNRGQQQVNKSDYAEQLRQQIETKKTLVDHDGFERNKRSSREDRDDQASAAQANHRRGQRSDQQRQSDCDLHHRMDRELPQQQVNKRTQYGSGGGKSSISLSWD